MTKHSPLKDKTIFVAGATGLAGTSIIEHLIAHYPDAYIRGTYRTSSPFLRHDRISYIRTDLTNRDECRRAVRGSDIAIMAAASTGGAGAAVAEPHKQVTNNLVMDAFVLEALYSEGVSRIVYLSSATVYPEYEDYIKEQDLDLNQEPHESYLGVGWAKRSAEKLCRFWFEKYGIEIVIVRCANIYGPYATFDPVRSNFIPAIIRKAADKMDPFKVWGSPDVVRDVIYSEDFATAVVLLLVHNEIKHDVFNLGSGKTGTVGEVVDASLRHGRHNPAKIVYSGARPTTIRFRALDCEKIKQTLEWKPGISLDEGIKRTTLWWINNKDWWLK